MTVRQDSLLADGRELFYYDAAPAAERSAPDLRSDLPPAQTSSQVRWDPLFRDYAVIAGHRQLRTYKPPATLCPLCPSHGTSYTEIPAEDYEVAVFENRFPSFSLQSGELLAPVERPLFHTDPGTGRCEVVCFTSEHDGSFAALSEPHARTVVDSWADRTSALSRIDSVEYVFCFENRGEEIGVTLSHPHGQIYGYPFVPRRFARAGEAARNHREQAGRCLQCHLLVAELAAQERIVSQSEHWVSYVPFAARWPFEVRVVPRAHTPDLPALPDTVRADLARVYLDVLQRFDGLFDGPVPYVAGWHQAPVRRERDSWHLAAEIFTIKRGRRRRSSTRPAPSRGRRSGSTTSPRNTPLASCAQRLRAAAERT